MLSFISKTLVFVYLILFSQVTHAWYDCNWSYRSDVVITENAGTALTDYQVLLNLNSASLHANYNWSSNGQDLRVIDTDDSSQLDFYLHSWNASAKTAEVWVKIPSLAANASKTIHLYYENVLAPAASTATITLTEPGIKFHTRNSTSNPNNKNAAFNFFNAAPDGVAGYGCKFITNFTGISNKNQFTPSTHSNFGAYSETFFEVKPSEVGTWSVRYGADFGFGGGLYVNGSPLEEDWNNDLWWANNWANADVLQGSISLSAGYHRLEVIGFEGCCDGGITVQFQKPGGSFQTYSTSNIDIVSRKCPTIEPTSAFATKTHYPPELTIQKTSEVISDPVNLTTFPKRIAGARVRYTIAVSNAGSPVDTDSINISDPVPATTDLLLANSDFSFQDGSPSSDLIFVYSGATNTSDDVVFSSTASAPYTYIPTPIANIDSNVRSFQMLPKGRFGCSNTTQATSFSLNYDVLIK